jgi:hypothetical protein
MDASRQQVTEISPRRPRLLPAVIPLWTVLVAAGFAVIMNYASVPGAAGQAPGHWPGDSGLKRERERLQLLLFAHPHCPCTRASLDELARVLMRHPNQARVQILVVTAATSAQDPEAASSWRRAAAIPGVAVCLDAGGIEARRFGIETSGHVVLFARDGELLFSGGITAGRGEAGASAGGEGLAALLNGRKALDRTAPVFGCPLFDPPSN